MKEIDGGLTVGFFSGSDTFSWKQKLGKELIKEVEAFSKKDRKRLKEASADLPPITYASPGGVKVRTAWARLTRSQKKIARQLNRIHMKSYQRQKLSLPK